jgi:uncharacterized damage-inducible protein DinB
MIGTGYVQRMARYNRWQNEKLYSAADGLSDEARRQQCGAFFGSIHGTLNHLLWADRMWMSRFADIPPPSQTITQSVALHSDWDEFKVARVQFDGTIIGWADAIADDWLTGALTYHARSVGRDVSAPVWLLVAHFFNHQTHHRGQVHCMLTQAGIQPGVTDLPFMPKDQTA